MRSTSRTEGSTLPVSIRLILDWLIAHRTASRSPAKGAYRFSQDLHRQFNRAFTLAKPQPVRIADVRPLHHQRIPARQICGGAVARHAASGQAGQLELQVHSRLLVNEEYVDNTEHH